MSLITSDLDLKQLLKGVKEYIGAFLVDELKKLKFKDNKFFLIVNLQHTGQQGSHWVLVVKLPFLVLYFDPFGMLMDKRVFSLMKRVGGKNLKLACNDIKYQSDESTYCGYMSALCAKKLIKCKDLKEGERCLTVDCVKIKKRLDRKERLLHPQMKIDSVKKINKESY